MPSPCIISVQVPTQPAEEYDYDVEYIQVPVQREVQVPVSIPVTVKKTLPGTEALQVRFLVAYRISNVGFLFLLFSFSSFACTLFTSP